MFECCTLSVECVFEGLKITNMQLRENMVVDAVHSA